MTSVLKKLFKVLLLIYKGDSLKNIDRFPTNYGSALWETRHIQLAAKTICICPIYIWLRDSFVLF